MAKYDKIYYSEDLITLSDLTNYYRPASVLALNNFLNSLGNNMYALTKINAYVIITITDSAEEEQRLFVTGPDLALRPDNFTNLVNPLVYSGQELYIPIKSIATNSTIRFYPSNGPLFGVNSAETLSKGFVFADISSVTAGYTLEFTPTENFRNTLGVDSEK